MNDSLQSVGIVGGGIAGCAAAIALRRAGREVTIYERVAVPGAIGAGLTLQPSGLSVLEALGLLPALQALGSPLEGIFCVDQHQRAVMTLRYPAPHYGLGIHRGLLFETLRAQAIAEGARYRAGCDGVGVSHRGNVLIRALAGEVQEVIHDLFVIADGARSTLRSSFPATARPQAEGTFWIVRPDPQGRDPKLRQFVRGHRQFFGRLPIGAAPGSSAPHSSVFWAASMEMAAHFAREGFSSMHAKIRVADPHTASLLDELDHPSQLIFARYHHVWMNQLVHRRGERVFVFIGDAAHAMGPQLGQGTNLALLDGWRLARALEAEPDLRAFERERLAHARRYSLATRFVTPFFQGGAKPRAFFRDQGLPLLMALPPARAGLQSLLRGGAFAR